MESEIKIGILLTVLATTSELDGKLVVHRTSQAPLIDIAAYAIFCIMAPVYLTCMVISDQFLLRWLAGVHFTFPYTGCLFICSMMPIVAVINNVPQLIALVSKREFIFDRNAN